MIRASIRSSVAWLPVVALLVAAPAAASATENDPSEVEETSDSQIQADLDEKVAKRRQAMMEEAHAALADTNGALDALDAGRTQEALDALARVTGKLELIVARDPELALAPVDVGVVTHDIYATPEAIRSARESAEELLEDGKVQEARGILSGLASEIVISVTNLPLATYPDAIKRISPLIDEGEVEAAKTRLRAALSTLVVTKQVVSLPALRARQMLDEAESLVNQEETSDEDRAKITELVDAAKAQLEMAELLGYGDENDHEAFRDQLAELRKKIGAEEESRGVFARLRRSLDGFQTSLFE